MEASGDEIERKQESVMNFFITILFGVAMCYVG